MSHPWEEIRLVQAIAPTVLGSSQTGGYVSLKNVNKAYIVVHLTSVAAAAVTVYPYQATAVAGTGAKVFANTLPIWSSSTFGGDETLNKQTAAVNFATDASTGYKCVIFEVQPGQMDLNGSFDVLNVRCSAGSTDQIIQAYYYLDMRYHEQDTPTVFGN